jgi:hypothetical protein
VEWASDRPPRFGLTARGRALSSDDRLFRKPVDPAPPQVHT